MTDAQQALAQVREALVRRWRYPMLTEEPAPCGESILATVALLSGLLHLVDPERYASPAFMLLSGGLMLGAVFMASDMVGSPMTTLGIAIYGVVIGVLVVAIRTWGGMPEGVMYAILLGNALSPQIDRLIRPTVYGTAARGPA